MKTVAIILLLAIVALTGCSSPQISTESLPGETKRPDEASGETGTDLLIVLKQSGGFAGVDESWRISADGRILASDGKASQASTDAIRAAVDELDSLGFFELNSSYVPLDTCCDRFTYQLSVTVDGKSHTVTALEGAQETPEEFWKAIDIVNSLLKEQE
jgi:hypothetical protein